MQLRYVFSELAHGLRRNLTMHLAVVLTLFVSLTLVGLGLLLQRQAVKAENYWGSQLQITVYLCTQNDDNPSCSGEVTDAQRQEILGVVEANPEVADYYTESKEVAFEKVKELLGPEKFSGPRPPVTAESMPESVWIELKKPDEFEGIVSAVQGLDGVSHIRDSRDLLTPIYGTIKLLRWGALATAVFLVVAAMLQVANTIRLAALARRREIGIMRLVGASTLYIGLPFLLEALVTAAAGVLCAGGALWAFMHFGIAGRATDNLKFMPWIGMPDYWHAMVWVAILGPILTVLPTLVLTGKYTKV